MEKIKIYVTSRIEEILLKDAEAFEFYKNDNVSLNKNALLNCLIENYYSAFSKEQDDLFSFIKDRIISDASINSSKIDGLCFEICEKLNQRTVSPNDENYNVLISFKPTKRLEPIIEYIEQYSLMGRSISEYYRSMFASYVSLPQDKREQIIFKTQYDSLLKAIKEHKKVFITTKRNDAKKIELSPYALANSKEELHMYLIGMHKGCVSLRLSRITSVRQLPSESEFSDEQIRVGEKMIKYGPQFFCRPYEKEALIKLTKKGIEKFRRIYVHRPMPISVEGNLYRFNCSYFQLFHYFTRFGPDAKIIRPKKLREEMMEYHRQALLQYEKDENK